MVLPSKEQRYRAERAENKKLRARMAELGNLRIETCTTCGGRGEYKVETVPGTEFIRGCAQCGGTGKRVVGPIVRGGKS